MAWAAIDPDGPQLAIGCAKAEQHLCLQIPGCTFTKKDGIWRAPLSWGSYVCFKTVWASQPVVEMPALLDWAASAWQNVQIAYGLRSQLDAGRRIGQEIDVIERIAKLEGHEKHLYPYQRGDVEWLITQRRAMLGHPRGNGKSPPLIRAYQVLRARGVHEPMLIISPPASLRGWARKLAEWAPELAVQIVAGTALRRKQALDATADVYLIGWPTVRFHTRLAAWPSQEFVRCTECKGIDPKITTGRCEVHLKELNSMRFAVLVADESHHMKDARSKQTRAVWWLASQADYFWPATGTPAADTIADFWPQGHAIDPRELPVRGRYLDLFAEKSYGWYGGVEVLGIRPDTERAYHAIVQPMIRRVPREIARPHQPPVLEPVFRYPAMTPQQASAYKDLRKHLLADFDGSGTLVPANAVVRFTRMCQLASSMVELEDGEDAYGFTRQQVELCLPSNKANDLMEVLEDHPGQMVVAANSPRLAALMAAKLDAAKISYVFITGGMNYYQQGESESQFQAGNARVCFITSAGAEAIDLFAASTIYFAQPDPSFISREQKIGRVDRIGQKWPVKVIHAITPGTVEGRLFELGCQKGERAAQLTRDADLLRWIVQGDDNDDPAAITAVAST
jgi:SNF2 family DNA or RNA helicase